MVNLFLGSMVVLTHTDATVEVKSKRQWAYSIHSWVFVQKYLQIWSTDGFSVKSEQKNTIQSATILKLRKNRDGSRPKSLLGK